MKSPATKRRTKHEAGVVYTPASLARLLARVTLDAHAGAGDLFDEEATSLKRPLSIVDPACGDGALLRAACDELGEQCGKLQLWGYDIDPVSVVAAEKSLRESAEPADVQTRLITANSLAVGAIEQGAFDVVVSNPPYISIRKLAHLLSREEMADLKSRYQTACGRFDLYVLFIELALRLLQPGGVAGFLVPNKIAAMDYARACREMVLQKTLVEVIDLSKLALFQNARVYPCIVVVRNEPPADHHCVRVSALEHWDAPQSRQVELVPQSQFSADRWMLAPQRLARIDLLANVQPLGKIATLVSGASGFTVGAMKPFVVSQEAIEEADRPRFRPLVVSGQIDRYLVKHQRSRFQNQYYQQPMLDVERARLTPAKRQLYASKKLVVSGMSQRLEVALDHEGCALAVQVFAIGRPSVDWHYLLALLNSSLMSFLFLERFAAKRLAAGYFSINLAQLAQLPILISQENDRAAKSLATELIELARSRESADACDWQAIDEQIDDRVFRLYGVDSATADAAIELLRQPAPREAVVTRRAA